MGTGSFALNPNASMYDLLRFGRFSMLLYALLEIMFRVVPVSTMCVKGFPFIFNSTTGHAAFRPVTLLITYLSSFRVYFLIISAALSIGLPSHHSLLRDADFGVLRDFFSSGDDSLLDDDRFSPANVLKRSNKLASLT
jgi:hypothetical protein